MSVSLSAHARRRMQQRGISDQALEVLMDIGYVGPAPGGGQIVFVDREARRRLGTHRPLRMQGADRLPRLYAITDDRGEIITVGHRYRRLPRMAGR